VQNNSLFWFRNLCIYVKVKWKGSWEELPQIGTVSSVTDTTFLWKTLIRGRHSVGRLWGAPSCPLNLCKPRLIIVFAGGFDSVWLPDLNCLVMNQLCWWLNARDGHRFCMAWFCMAWFCMAPDSLNALDCSRHQLCRLVRLVLLLLNLCLDQSLCLQENQILYGSRFSECPWLD